MQTRKLNRAQRRNAYRMKIEKWPGRLAIHERYDSPPKVSLNRSKHWIWAGDYKTAREISPYADDPEFSLVH